MSIVFYQAPMSSASPVAWALAELGVLHESVRVDLAAKDQRKPEFLALNPNGKVPTLVVDGTPMFEALAIMMWLSHRYGIDKKLWPANDDLARLQALSWSTWAYVTVGPAIGRLLTATSPRIGKEFHNAAQADQARKELAGLLSILDARLAAQPYMLGASFSMVDLIDASVVGYAAMTGVDVAAHPRVLDWLARCQARPAFRTVG
jgi:glutathione S-transferase